MDIRLPVKFEFYRFGLETYRWKFVGGEVQNKHGKLPGQRVRSLGPK